MTERAYLPAVVGPAAAWMISRDYAPVLREWETKGRTLVAGGQTEAGRQLLSAVAQIRESGRQRLEGHRVEQQEQPVTATMTPQDAAAELRISDRQVTKLANLGVIVGYQTKGRRWVLDAMSVMDYRDRRDDEIGA